MSIPILDEAYMERRRRERYWEKMAQTNRHSFGRYGHSLEPPPETAESLREQYATGDLTFAQFERRIERLLGCT